MIVVGLTGNLSAGKSQAARIFKKLGAEIFDADVSARQAVSKGKPAYKAIVKIFGDDFLQKNGQINRKKLAKHVFSHPKDLKKLNILIHPSVILDAMSAMERFKNKKGVLILDVPLLFESKMEKLAEFVVVVTATQEAMLKRSSNKGVDVKLAKNILSSQWPLKKKKALANFVITNNGSTADLEKRVKKIFNQINKDYPPQSAAN